MSSPEDGRKRQELLNELRETAPPAPERLRTRVEQLAGQEPVPRVTLRERLSARRAALVLAPALLVLAIGGVTVGALVSGDANDDGLQAAEVTRTAALEALEQRDGGGSADAGTPETGQGALRAAAPKSIPQPAARAQDYRVSMRLLVKNPEALSNATKQALTITRALGGYVVSVDYDIPGSEGDARLELRVLRGRIQTAVVRYSSLGSILAQQVNVRDLQATIDRHTRQLDARENEIRDLLAKLRDPLLPEHERAALDARLGRLRAQSEAQRAERAALTRQARFAKVSLTLTTRERTEPGAAPGGIEKVLRDAGGILATELGFVLYALIVSAPFLLLAAFGAYAARIGRRRADERLLERA